MAREDRDLPVRLAAIARVAEPSVLRELLDATGTDDALSVRAAAEKRLIDRFSDGKISDIAARALLSTHAPRLAVATASDCVVATQREMSLQAIDDEQSLLAVVQQSRFHDTRLAAAMRLVHHDSLKSALSAVRSKDKAVAKQLQQRLDSAAAEEEALIATRHAVSTTLQAAQSLSEGVWTPQHAGKLQALRERWAGFTDADRAESEDRFKVAIERAEQNLHEYSQRQIQENAEGVAESAAAADDASVARDSDTAVATDEDSDSNTTVVVIDDPTLDVALQKLRNCSIAQLAESLSQPEDTGTAEPIEPTDAVQKLTAYCQAVAVLFDPPYEINKARPGALQQRIKRVDSLLDINKLIPGIDISEHAYFKELAEHASALQDRMGKARQESADRIKATHRQFAALSGIIKEGKWGPANSMMRRLKKKIEAMESTERASLDDKLSRADKQLAEMADWQDFAARPKLAELCDAMEVLPAKELAPQELAKQVRDLQNQWKALGVSRASNELWPRFKTAGDNAYEPCKAWFAQKQEERQKKLDVKASLCEQLEAEAAALTDDPDWKAIARRVSNAKREWSRNRVPDRKPDKSLESRFSNALIPFETGLTEQYEANAALKKELIEKVESLANAEITQHSANQAKRLLSAWKLVGVMRRKEDQALWDVFNSHLGTIFKHQHKVEREKQRAGLEHVYRARDIIKRLKTLARGDAIDESEVQTLATEFQALAEFPERDRKFLLRDFRQAVDACSRVQDNASKRRQQAGQEESRRLLNLCEQLEDATGQPGTSIDTLVDDVTHAWQNSDIRVSADMDSLLSKRRDEAIKHLKQGTTPDYITNEALRRDLLIRMEVAAGIETPSEDKARRMQYQLEHLQQSMSSAGIDDAKQALHKLEQQWLAIGPVKPDVRDSLNSRYLKCCKR